MTTERVRLVTQIPEELRQALRLEAASRNMDMSDILIELLTENLTASLAEVRRRRQQEESKKQKGK